MEKIIAKAERITVDVVIPVYNEEQLLEHTVKTLSRFLSAQEDFVWRIVIASNGSTDGTREIGESLAQTHSRISFFHISKRGRGRALRKAFSESTALVCAYTDVDLSVDIYTLLKLLKYAVKHTVIAMPNRLAPYVHVRRPLHRILFSKIYNLLIRILFPGTGIRDAQVGMKAIHRSILEIFLKKVKNNNFFFDTELLLLAERAGFPIIQMPSGCYDMRRRNFSLIRDIYEGFIGLVRMRFRLTFFQSEKSCAENVDLLG